MVCVNLVRSIVNEQFAAEEPDPLAVADVAVGPVPEAVVGLAAGADVTVAVTVVAVETDVAAEVTETLMTTHNRESSPMLMISPAGFLMT
jgi:predicted dienelactone hydrolase